MAHIPNSRLDIRKIGLYVSRLVTRASLYAVITGGAVLFGLPFLWMVRTTIMPPWQIYTFPPQWIPAEVHLETILRPWRDLPFARYYFNTAYMSMLGTLGVVVSCSMVAYGFARLRFPGRDILFMVLLSTMMLPAQVTLIPRYLLFTKLRWVNSFRPLIIPYWFGTSAYNVFLLRQFFMTVPLEMDDAAKIDGCNPFGIYWRILLPMSLPALGAVAIMHFMWSWNWFLGPLIYINSYEKYTLSLGLMIYRSRLELAMDALMSGAVQALIPALALFFLAQRYFIQGIVITGIKG